MLAPSAADRNGHVAAICLVKVSQYADHKFVEAFIEATRSLIVIQELCDWRVQASHATERGVPVRIG